MNRSAEQTNRPRTASRLTRFVCPASQFIANEPRKKDTHSLIEFCSVVAEVRSKTSQPITGQGGHLRVPIGTKDTYVVGHGDLASCHFLLYSVLWLQRRGKAY